MSEHLTREEMTLLIAARYYASGDYVPPYDQSEGLFQMIAPSDPSTPRVLIESTAQGLGDTFYDRWVDAQAAQPHHLFSPWRQ